MQRKSRRNLTYEDILSAAKDGNKQFLDWVEKMLEKDFIIKTEEWHNGAGEGLKLHEYLGMSFEQYGEYLKPKSNTVKEEFEHWAVSEGWNLDHTMIHELWLSWKASREHLVVELPYESLTDYDDDGQYDSGYNWCLDDVKRALRQHGIKWK